MDRAEEVWLRRGSQVNGRFPVPEVRAHYWFAIASTVDGQLRFEVSYDCSVELSPLGYQFLTVIFENYDKDQDGALNKDELEELFSTSPGNPWAGQKFPDTTVADDTGAVTLQGWLAQWRYVSIPCTLD